MRKKGLTIAMMTLESREMSLGSGHETTTMGWLNAPRCRFVSIWAFWGTRSRGGLLSVDGACVEDVVWGICEKRDQRRKKKLYTGIIAFSFVFLMSAYLEPASAGNASSSHVFVSY